MTSSNIKYFQFEYPSTLYKQELKCHRENLKEYSQEICSTIIKSMHKSKPNIDLYQQQPYLTFAIRAKLIDFLLKMSVRLKILPFVFYKAVKIFDRYCSKRVVLLDQSQLIITTCLWIASKIQGGNNHFVNLNNINKIQDVKIITDLGYGSGGRFLGPTERFRLPKLHELVKLCGAKCKYDQGMFIQMELHVLNTLEWNLNDPSIEEVLISSEEFNIDPNNEDVVLYNIFKTKEYLSYLSLYSFELIDVNIVDISRVICSITNEYLNIRKGDRYYQTINKINIEDFDITYQKESSPNSRKMHSSVIRSHLINAIKQSSDFINQLFDFNGPQQLFHVVVNQHKYHTQNFMISPSINNIAPIVNNKSTAPSTNVIAHYRSQTHAKPPPISTGEPVRKKNFAGVQGNYTFNSISAQYSNDESYNISSAVMPNGVLKYSSEGDESTPTNPKIPGVPNLNNNSQISLHSEVSSKNDHGSIFEFEGHPTSGNAGTPVSEAYSPMVSNNKQTEG